MSNFAFMTQGGHPAGPTFNSAFYATITTVIPVLYLALVVQEPRSSLYSGLIKAARNAVERVNQSSGIRQNINSGLSLVGLIIFPGLILGYGVIAEILGLISLYMQKPVELIPSGPLIAAGFLVLMAAAEPGRNLGMFVIQAWRDSPGHTKAGNPRTKQQSAGSGDGS